MALDSLRLSRARDNSCNSWWCSYQFQRHLSFCSPSHARRILEVRPPGLSLDKPTLQVLVNRCGQGFAWPRPHFEDYQIKESLFPGIVEAEATLGYVREEASSLMNVRELYISGPTLQAAFYQPGTFDVIAVARAFVFIYVVKDLLSLSVSSCVPLPTLAAAFSFIDRRETNPTNRKTWVNSLRPALGCRLVSHHATRIRDVLRHLPLTAQYYVLSHFDLTISQEYLDHLATCLPPHQHLLLCFRQDHDAGLASIAHLRALGTNLDAAVSPAQRCELVREVRGRGIAWALFWLLDLWPAAASALECAVPSALCDLLRYDCDSDLDIRLLDHLDQRWDLCRLIAASRRLSAHTDRPMFHRRTHYGTRTLAWLLDRHPRLMVDQVDGSGRTLLHWTAEHGDAASLLVMAERATEAMRCLRDKHGRMASMLVAERAGPYQKEAAAALEPS